LTSPGGKGRKEERERGREGAVTDARWDGARSKNEAYFMWDVVCRELIQHLSSQSAYDTLPGLPSTTGAVLRLDGQDSVQCTVSQVALVAEEDMEQENKDSNSGT